MQRNHNVFKSDLQEIKEIYYDIRIREDIRVFGFYLCIRVLLFYNEDRYLTLRLIIFSETRVNCLKFIIPVGVKFHLHYPLS